MHQEFRLIKRRTIRNNPHQHRSYPHNTYNTRVIPVKTGEHHRSTRNIPRETRTFSRSEQYQRQNCKMNHHNIFHNLLLYAVHIISQNPPGYTKCQHELTHLLQFTSISITSNHAIQFKLMLKKYKLESRHHKH